MIKTTPFKHQDYESISAQVSGLEENGSLSLGTLLPLPNAYFDRTAVRYHVNLEVKSI